MRRRNRRNCQFPVRPIEMLESPASCVLRRSAEACGLVAEDGAASVRASIESGARAGRQQPRQAPNAAAQSDDQGDDQRNDGEEDATLRIVTAADTEMAGVDWLWPDRFALGKIGLIAGLPDMGKGQIAAFIAAAVTASVDLPCGEGRTTQGNVIWFNAEDDARDTVKPRLVAAGADLKRVHFVSGARVGGKDKTFSLVTDLPLLREAINRIGNVVLVMIDPVSAYLGVGKVDGCADAAEGDGRRTAHRGDRHHPLQQKGRR